MPARPKFTDKEFIELFQNSKSLIEFATSHGMDLRSVKRRRRKIEEKFKIALKTLSDNSRFQHLQTAHRHTPRLNLGIENGTVLVFSDAHFYPGIHSTVFKGLLWAIKELNPVAVIANGDVFDGQPFLAILELVGIPSHRLLKNSRLVKLRWARLRKRLKMLVTMFN